MRVALASTLLIVALSVPGCSGGSGDDVDGGNGNGDGSSGSAGVVAVESVSPDHGPLAGGTIITITGQGFLLDNAQPDSVLIGGVACGEIQLIDDRTMKVETPPGQAAGAVDVVVFNSNGFDTAAGGFSYNPQPTVTAVTADNGPAGGGETVTITGTGFQELEAGDNRVFFGENEGSEVTVASDTELTVVTPPGEAFSLVDVAVVNDNGAGEKPKGYEYNPTGDTIVALSRPGSSGCGCGVAARPAYFGTPYADAAQPLETATLFSVDPATGAVASMTTAEEWLNGMARASDGTIYGVMSRRSADVDLARKLVTVDLATGGVTPVGSLMIAGVDEYAPQDITFVSSVLFGVSRRAGASDSIHTINTFTGQALGVGGSNLTSGGNGLVFTGTKLYVSNYNGLCEVDTTNGAATNCIPSAERVRAMTMANGKMYGASPDVYDYYQSRLLEIDPANNEFHSAAVIPGTVTALVTIPKP